MAKSSRGGKTAYEKQQTVIDQFQRDIRSERNRDWLNATEQCVAASSKLKTKPVVEQPRFSQYNPNNPLNGSGGWSKTQWNYFKLFGTPNPTPEQIKTTL